MSCLLPKQVQNLILLLVFSLAVAAEDKSAHTYDQTGTITAIPWDGRSFQIATDNRIYRMSCAVQPHFFQFGLPTCKNNENKPFAVGDTVHFRVDRDLAYMLLSKGKEERFGIDGTYLKMVPPLPSGNASDQSASQGQERAIVVGTRLQLQGTYSSSPVVTTSSSSSASSAPSAPSGPILAVPATGGPPQVIIPTGSSSGGIVTGVPVTGGPPITGISTEPTPISTSSSADANLFPTTSSWPTVTRVVRIQSSDKIYDLACPRNSCTSAGKVMALGDIVTFRKDRRWVYFGSDRYEILKVMDKAPATPEVTSTSPK